MYGNDKDDAMHQLKLNILNHKEVLSLDANLDAEAVVSEISSFVDCVVNVTGVAKENIINYPGKVWWNTIGREKFPILFKVASRLFVIPTSSAASERIWSVYDFIHTKRRNRLNTDKVDKLVSLHANASIEALLKKEADFARIMMEESLSDSDNESRSRGGDSEVVIAESSSLEFYMPGTLASTPLSI